MSLEKKSEAALKAYIKRTGGLYPGPGSIYEHGFADGYGLSNQEMGWQPIETAPKDGRVVMAFDPQDGPYVITSTFWDSEGKYWVSLSEPTHWMPLPEPPTEREAEVTSEVTK